MKFLSQSGKEHLYKLLNKDFEVVFKLYFLYLEEIGCHRFMINSFSIDEFLLKMDQFILSDLEL